MRHWVIANGKSLLDTPLHLLKDEITWGMNRIHLLYDKTDWRPSRYLMVDYQKKEDYECIKPHWNTKKYLWDGFREGNPYFFDPIGEVPNTTWIPRCKKHHYYMADNWKAAQSWHLPEICTAFSGIGAVIQLAVQEGATEIYIVGADEPAHVHQVAKRSSPVPIYNCTVGGALEVYERKNLLDVLNG